MSLTNGGGGGRGGGEVMGITGVVLSSVNEARIF